ncbi:xanthine dehydrogenase family protein molybdopterin-binding subunit [Hydrogenobacter thermophilus]|uniref:xanthine dehydrogenase family protein molybdopterin-binding subunit n=1 Tax=Hydrogenobacter thermophilus TaxID=940 RepID=UPI0030FB3BFF
MITRRELLKAGALSIGVFLLPDGVKILKAQETSLKPALWASISKDNHLTLLVNKSEMGQGVYTGLAMIVADELDFPWERVRVKPAPAGSVYIDRKMGAQLTGGSTSVRNMYEFLRLLGASMREMLLTSASREWKVSKEKLSARMGYITDGTRKASYGELWEKAIKLPVPENPKLKEPSEFIYIGKNVSRIDVPEKVDGKAVFGIDVRVKDMIYALVERPPYFGSKVMSYDANQTRRVKGVIDTFPISTGVAVCASSFESALKGREKLRVEWSKSPLEGFDDEKLERYYLDMLKRKGLVARSDGNALKKIEASPKKVEAVYLLPYLYHATMEPMACVADVREDRCVVYAPLQAQTWALKVAKEITGLPEDKIEIHTTYLGGGFGRKSNVEFVREAIEISKKVKRPVKLIYTREDDVKSGWYRPMNATLLKGAIDEKGKVIALYHKIAVPAVFEWAGRPSRIDRAAVEGIENMFYEVPDLHVEFVKVDLPIPVWFWRSVGSSHNAFTLETFIDRLAKMGKRDPVDLRLELLKNHERAQKVIEVAVEKAGWGKKPRYGEAMGIAYHFSFGSHVAEVAEVSLDRKSGQVRVHRVVCAIDLGPMVVHPDLVVSQMESAINMGLSAALKEKVRFSKNGPASTNFDTYSLLTMAEAPQIEVHIVRGEGPMGGVGEPGLPPIAPAVANALLWGYGIEVNSLPMTPDYIKTLLKEA